MAWLGRWKRKRLALTWTYTATGQLWRLLRSGSDRLLVEERDIEGKRVVFTFLHAGTGEAQWSKNPFDEQWWISVEAIHENVLFLHGYATPDMPDHKKVIAVDLRNGEPLWSNPDMKYISAAGKSVFAIKDSYDRRQCFELDLHTGEILREVEESGPGIPRAGSPAEADDGAQFPIAGGGSQNDDDSLPESVRTYVAGKADVEMLEWIDYSSASIVGYYQRHSALSGEPWLSHSLAVLEQKEGQLLFETELDSKMRIAVPDMFFCSGGMLYFIKEKKTLCAVNLVQG